MVDFKEQEPRVIIIGAGPGGLSSAMMLANQGFQVDVFEKNSCVGGRNAELKVGDFSFDTGPTFLHTDFVVREIFAQAGENVDNYLDIVRLDPLNRLIFKDVTIDGSSDQEFMRQQIAEKFPGNEKGYDAFMAENKVKNQAIFGCLDHPYLSLFSMMHPRLWKAAPFVFSGKTVQDDLERYFDDERLQLAFSFQTKYLGMAPWKCPAFFSIMAYWEFAFGLFHVKGGLCKLSQAMGEIVEKKGGKIHFNSPVKEVLYEGKKATGVTLQDGSVHKADEVIINADAPYAMTNLLGKRNQSKEKLAKKEYSCSTFMIYLGVDKKYDDPFHQFIVSDDYRAYAEEVDAERVIPRDASIYVRNSSLIDEHVAPEGKSGIYILVPVANNRNQLDWEEKKQEYRDHILSIVEERTGMKDLREHIEVEKIVTPADWEAQNIFMGATFSMKHLLKQMLYFRPHNRLDGFNNAYLVGGGTHPGSGLIPIYQSGRIAAKMISERHGRPFEVVDYHTEAL